MSFLPWLGEALRDGCLSLISSHPRWVRMWRHPSNLRENLLSRSVPNLRRSLAWHELAHGTRLRLRKGRTWLHLNGRNLLDKIPALKFTAHCWKYKYCLFCAQRHCVLLLNLVPCRPRLFKRWISLSTGLKSIQWISQLVSLILIYWIVIYPVDSAIQRLNVPGPGLFRVNISHFLFRTTRTTRRL